MDINDSDSDFLEFEIWLKNGFDRGWVSDVFCNPHDGSPMTEEEMQEWDEGGDPCSFQVRLNYLQ